MSREWPDRLRDILDAAAEIRTFVAGMDEERFGRDRKTLMAVLAEIAIIGEAAAHLPEEVRAKQPHVPWIEIRRMRNVVVHVYHGVDPAKVWNVIEVDLKPLEQAVRDLLADE